MPIRHAIAHVPPQPMAGTVAGHHGEGNAR
jgi:hypothetical protein